MRNRRQLLADHEETREIRPAFTDVMSTMALILFVLVLLSYVRNLIASKRLDALALQITTSEAQLTVLNRELASGKAALRISEDKLRGQEAVIADSNQLTHRAPLAAPRNRRPPARRGAEQAEASHPRGARPHERRRRRARHLRRQREHRHQREPRVRVGLVCHQGASEARLERAREGARQPARRRGRPRQHRRHRHPGAHRRPRVGVANWDLSAKRCDRRRRLPLPVGTRSSPTPTAKYFAAEARVFEVPPPRHRAYGRRLPSWNRRIEISVVPKDGSVRKVIDDYMQSIPADVQPPAAKP